jgi:hypothetical protein
VVLAFTTNPNPGRYSHHRRHFTKSIQTDANSSLQEKSLPSAKTLSPRFRLADYLRHHHFRRRLHHPASLARSTKAMQRYTAGLVARSGEIGNETKTFRYSSALSWRGLAKQPVLEVESSAIEKWLGLEVASTSTKILFRWNGRGFDSDLTLPPQTTPLPAGDIALSLGRVAWDTLPGDLFLDAANLPDRSQWKPLPPIERYAVWLDKDRLIEGRYIGFSDPLDQELAARVLGLMGVTERRALTLPDGTVSYERLLPTASTSTDLFGRRQNDRGQWIDLSPRFILVSNASTTLDQSNVAPCSMGYPWLRLSQNALHDMLGISLPSLQALLTERSPRHLL